MNQYEAMFLFDPTFGNTFEKCEGEIRRLMDRAAAEIILCQKWDERRLAFKIKGRKRGVYVLTYFKAAADKITGLERDAKLSENILRLLVLRADGLTREAMEQTFHRRYAEPTRDDAHAEPRREHAETVVAISESGEGKRSGRKRKPSGGDATVTEPPYDAMADMD